MESDRKYLKIMRKIFFSVRTILVLVMGLTGSIITATLLERAYDTAAAKSLIYNAWWFETLWVWVSVALFVNLIHFKLWRREKWAGVLFPFAFLTILSGVIITQQFAIEGYLSLREGESSNRFFSSRPYLQIHASNELASEEREYELWLSTVDRTFEKTLKVGETSLSIQLQRHIINPKKDIVQDSEGRGVLELELFTPHISQLSFLEKGEIDSLLGVYFVFGDNFKANTTSVQLENRGGEIWVSSNRSMIREEKDSGRKISYKPGVSTQLDNSSIYTLDSISFTLARYLPEGRIRAIPSESSTFFKETTKTSEAIDLVVKTVSCRRIVSLFAEKNIKGRTKVVRCGDMEVELQFGAKQFHFPFSLHLVNFNIERYKDSQKPSQFQSDVIVKDAEYNIEKSYSIYMNHILRYRGYRFYQYSFDKDEKGSVFFVSRDPGTPVVYAGFFLLFGVLALSIFHPKSRIRMLDRDIRESV